MDKEYTIFEELVIKMDFGKYLKEKIEIAKKFKYIR